MEASSGGELAAEGWLGVAEAASSAFSPGVGVSAQALTHVN